ncbi:MAG: hypothetical protein IJ783_03510, partial [Kiritimatiellae bacterium]|nr:hypothetical protein [Kiritimatiellia bacterium]
GNLLAVAEREDAAAAALFSRGLYGAAHSNLWNLVAAAKLAAAAAEPVRRPKGAMLAVWEPTGFGGLPGGWTEAAEKMAAAGVTDVFAWCGSPAGAVPDVPGVPSAGSRAGRPDPLASAVRECHARGIKVHAWVAALSFENPPPERMKAFEKAGRLLHGPDGRAIAWLDPGAEANAAEVSRIACALAARGVDGINLDFIRYPGSSKEKTDAAKIEAVVAKVRADLAKAAPRATLSACVYGWYPGCIASRGQDWYAWLDKGLVDFAVPMNYAPDTAALRKIVDLQKRGRGRLVCGIGAGANESRLDAVGLLRQLREAYRAGYRGAAVYPFDARFAEELAPALESALQ